jgi:EpsI family protein
MKPTFDNFTEPKIDRRKLVLGLLFGSAAATAALRAPTKHLDHLGNQKLDDLVPKKIGSWNFVANSGLVVPPNDPLLNALYSQQLTRVYSDGQSPPLMLLMAQSGSQTGFLQVHRPDFCYTASGYRISAVSPHPIRLASGILPASMMDATTGGTPEHVVFWTRIGDRIPGSWTAQKIAVAEQNLRGIIPDAILVRISVISEDGNAARAAIDAFVQAMLESVPLARRSVFVV